MIELERRFTPGAVEVRAADKRAIGGYAAKFNKLSRNLGGFQEQLDRSAFNRARGNGWPEVMARYNHDDNMMLGTIAGRTLRLEVDDTGLVYEVDMPQSRSDVYELIQRGDVSKSSFAFRVLPDGDEWGLTEDNFPLRTLRSLQLVDVAPVNVPAYVDTSTGLRSLAEHMHADPDEVRSMAQAGELVRLFKRSDGGHQATFGPAARVALLARATPPWE